MPGPECQSQLKLEITRQLSMIVPSEVQQQKELDKFRDFYLISSQLDGSVRPLTFPTRPKSWQKAENDKSFFWKKREVN
jgi:hypothetical protein